MSERTTILAAIRTDVLPEMLVPGLILAGVLLILGIVFLVARSRFRSASEDDDTHNILDEFRELKLKGELSEEEFKRIRSSLSHKIRDQMQAKEKPAKDE